MPDYRLITRLVHAGEHLPTKAGGSPTAMPIFTSTTFVHPTSAQLDEAFAEGSQAGKYVYTRYGNPTVSALETVMCSAEGGRGAVACSSGMMAIYLSLLAAGTPRGATQHATRHILAAQDLFGSTHTLLRDFFSSQGVGVSYFDPTDLRSLESKIDRYEPDVVLIESLSNPLLKVADIASIASLAHANDARVVVDATMTTPILHQPLNQGADIVVHSATKYLGGHADVSGGILVTRTGMLYDNAVRYSRLLGSNLGPYEAHLVARGIKTLSLRVRQQCSNALLIADWLQYQPSVSRVIYPGLKSHAQHELATRQFGGLYGGIITFDLANADLKARRHVLGFMDHLELILAATSLGDVFSLITYPAISSHRDLTPEQRQSQGISEETLRLSVGIEDADDIMADLAQAFIKSSLTAESNTLQ